MVVPHRHRPPADAVRRRQDKVVEWSRDGYATEQIARSLVPPVKPNIVSGDKAARRLQLEGAVPLRRKHPDPPSFDWMTAPLPEARPAYLLNAPMQRVEALLTSLRDMNARAKLPHNIAEARALGDNEWFTRSQSVLIDAIRYLAEMLQIMQDEEARAAALQPSARDDINADKRAALLNRDRPSAGVGYGTPLPAKGNGVLPARVFQVLMAWHWAGENIESDEVTDSIVLREHSSPNRVQEAARELKPALQSAGWD